MATITKSWYEGSNNIVLKQDITEVEIVRSYNPTGNEIVSWDASADLDGSVMAYITGTKVTLVCDSLTEIPERMFDTFISLERITGLGSVTTVGALAFWRCYSVASLDLIPENLTNIGDDAFRMSSVEDVLDMSRSNAVLGARATRSQRWNTKLSDVQSVEFPAHKIFFDVPNPDSQQKEKYGEIPFVKPGTIDPPTLWNGCSVFTMYHTWNCLYAGTDKVYEDMEAWWNATLNKNKDFAETTVFDSYSFWTKKTTPVLGWDYEPNTDKSDDYTPVKDESQLETILNELSNGRPVNTTVKTATYSHNVLIIGCDPATRKLAFVDSGVRPDRGVILWCAFEDMYIEDFNYNDSGDQAECIRLIDYKQPILAPRNTWFKPSNTAITKPSITEIEFISNYQPTGNEIDSWDASAKQNESVMAYVTGTKLTLSFNKPEGEIYGFDYIYANPDSYRAFADDDNANCFTGLATVTNASLLNTSKAINMHGLFRRCGALTSIDVSNWDLSSCVDISYMFQRCTVLPYLDVSKWDTSKVATMENMFHRCDAINGVDVSKWDTSSCKNMISVFNVCSSLTELDLSNWDTKHCNDNISAQEGYDDMNAMLNSMPKLQKITLGARVKLNEAALLPSPSAEYIPYADGYWYDHDYNAYAPADIPSNVARTYYASKFIAADDDDEMVFVRNGTLRKMAVAIRHKNGKTDGLLPSDFAEEVLALEIQQN